MNAEMFWSCVGAILFLGALRVSFLVALGALETYLKSKTEAQ